jgi:hypothetical protein
VFFRNIAKGVRLAAITMKDRTIVNMNILIKFSHYWMMDTIA